MFFVVNFFAGRDGGISQAALILTQYCAGRIRRPVIVLEGYGGLGEYCAGRIRRPVRVMVQDAEEVTKTVLK